MKVLAADDNPISQTVLRNMLTKWGYDVVTACDGDQAWQVLQSPHSPSIAILDWMMPGTDGVDLCRRLRAAGRERYTYVLVLTSRSDSDDVVEALEAGADDYLTKPFNSSELRARLRAGRRIIELQEQLMAAQEELRMRATHDGLTGLLNRSAITEILGREMARCSREGQPVSIVMADLDKFKQVNDTFGHQAGDAVLREAAARMHASFRCYDSIGRYGGEEFLVVLPACDEGEVWSLGERFRVLISASPFTFGQNLLAISCSIGCATQPPGDAWDADSIIRLADEALYDAKHSGRNCTVSAGHQLALQ
jgi:two-component system, cell cycle response regulator